MSASSVGKLNGLTAHVGISWGEDLRGVVG